MVFGNTLMSMKFESVWPTPNWPSSAQARSQWILVPPSLPNRSKARSVLISP
jgi:hypothetical protein